MTKRKSDIFTVAKSIMNWFAASEHFAGPTEVGERVADCLEALGDPTVWTTVDGWTDDGSKAIIDSWSGCEVGQRAANWPETITDLKGRYGVATWPTFSQQLAVEAEVHIGAVDSQRASKDKTGSVDRFEQGVSTGAPT